MALNDKQRKMCLESRWDFSGLKALFLNCTLKPTPELSHTDGLIEKSPVRAEPFMQTDK